ncbi:hypothetical protein [Tardiphaga sp.]|jgi:hypothetical protein|uniref:hypothetical protein n=1 Tax=Tardiphaga sp. TaxID=1926292 RepID=UPI0037DA50A7
MIVAGKGLDNLGLHDRMDNLSKAYAAPRWKKSPQGRIADAGIRGFESEWRTRHDSNV